MPRQTIPLTAFAVCDAEPGTSVDDVRRMPEMDWLPATVPGGVHEALLAAGRIADPYFDRNEGAVRWVEERDWWFRTHIPAPRPRVVDAPCWSATDWTQLPIFGWTDSRWVTARTCSAQPRST